MKEYDKEICTTQKGIYQYMAVRMYNMNIFSKCYLESKFCELEMDSTCSHYHGEFSNECVSAFMPEIEDKLEKQDFMTNKILAGNIGYLYRKLYIETSVPSKKLAVLIPFETMMGYCKDLKMRGFEEIISDIIRDYKLSRCRYDKDEVYMSSEEFDAFEKRIKEEARQELRELGISEDEWSPWLKEDITE